MTGPQVDRQGPLGPSGRNRSGGNMDLGERVAFGAGGAALLLLGLRVRGAGRALPLLLGGGLALVAARGRDPLATALKINMQEGEVKVSSAVTVGKPLAEVYAEWRDLTRLPQLMSHLQRVELLGDGLLSDGVLGDGLLGAEGLENDGPGQRSRWTAAGPLGDVSWEATARYREPDGSGEGGLSWTSLPGSGLSNSGEVRFRPAPGDRGTEVLVRLSYRPPGGLEGAVFARLRGQEPGQQLRDDLARFKQRLELGFAPTTRGQSSGRGPGDPAGLYDPGRSGTPQPQNGGAQHGGAQSGGVRSGS